MMVMVDPWEAMRGRLVNLAWPDGLPTTVPTVQINQNVGYLADTGDVNCSRVDVLTCQLPLGDTTIPPRSGNTTVVHLVHPTAPNNRAVIVHGGHGEHYYSGLNASQEGNLRPLVAALLRHGYTVIGCAMPNMWISDVYVNGVPTFIDGLHTGMARIEQYSSRSALPFFVEHVIQAINYVGATYSFDSIDMTGLSGGGWTTNFAAAMDRRIRRNYCVFGAMPFSIRQILVNHGYTSFGDWEQRQARAWWPLLGNLEENLYVLTCRTPGRRRMQVVGENEPAFPVAGLHAEVSAYGAYIDARVPPGQHEILIDTTPYHQYSQATIDAIIADMASP